MFNSHHNRLGGYVTVSIGTKLDAAQIKVEALPLFGIVCEDECRRTVTAVFLDTDGRI